MSNQEQDQKIPTKEEIVAFLTEQIEVKELQAKLQKLSTSIAIDKAEELKALSFIGQMTNPRPQGNEYQGEGTPHTITQEDLDNNPELVEEGLKVGDEVLIPKEAIITDEEEIKAAKKERALKKK